jgi:hypothetical protein
MGQSTDAIIAFGVDLGEELPEFLEEFDGEFDEFLASISGLPKWGEPGHSYEAHEAFAKAFPVTIIYHCSGDYPMYVLAVNGTEQRAWRGEPQTIEPLVVSDEQIAALRDFMNEHELDGDLGWLLFSNWA